MRTRSLLFLVAAAGCTSTSASSTDAAAVRRTIDSLDVAAERWIAAGATDSLVAGYYTSDAILMIPNTPAAQGSSAIRAAMLAMKAQGLSRLHLQISSLRVADSLASDEGVYTLEVRGNPPADTTKVVATDHGNFVTTFVYRNGQWRAIYDIANSDVPLAPPPAPPARKK